LTPPELAVILAVPGATCLAGPVALTVAAAGFEELQLTWL
jgi:hypothetical protein